MDSSTLLPNQTSIVISTVCSKRIPWTTDDIAEIIKEHSIVLFSRGTKQYPRCGFSARTIDYLDSKGVEFFCIDVLADKSIVPAITALYGQHCSFPLVVTNGQLISDFDELQFAMSGCAQEANS